MSSVKELLRGNVIDGTGTANYIPKFIDTTSVGSSNIFDNGTNVGIGTTSPQGNLHIATTGNATLVLEGDTDNSGDSDTQVDATIRMMTDGGTNWWDIEAINRSQNAGYLNFNFTGSGSAKVGMFTDSPTMELDVVGRVRASQGIYFGSDTAAANGLDDYEEGTWTPAIGTEGGTAYTLSSSTGIYTKIGNIVYVEASITFTAEGSGPIAFISLPFLANARTVLNGYVTSGNNRRSMQFSQYSGATVLVRPDDGTQYLLYTDVNGASWSPTNTFRFSGVYKIE